MSTNDNDILDLDVVEMNQQLICDQIPTTDPNSSNDCCCIKSQDIKFDVCQDVREFTLSDVKLNCEGRFLKVKIDLDNVCGGRTLAVGVLLCENVLGTVFTRGFKVREVSVPGQGCQCNVSIGEFCFILPDENLCCERTVTVKVIAHYSSFPSFPFCPC